MLQNEILMKNLLKKARILWQKNNEKEALEILSLPEFENNNEALFLIGQIYSCAEKGFSNIKKDDKKAIEYWKKAIELKHSHSAFELGNSYFFGNGVRQNKKLAEHYYNLGFEYKTFFFEFCGLNLIDLYYDSNEFDKCIATCIKLIKEKKLLGNCYYFLFKCYFKENTKFQNIKLAFSYLEKGVKKRNIACCNRLAEHLIKGEYLEKNIEKAIMVLESILSNKEAHLFHKETTERIDYLKKLQNSK